MEGIYIKDVMNDKSETTDTYNPKSPKEIKREAMAKSCVLFLSSSLSIVLT